MSSNSSIANRKLASTVDLRDQFETKAQNIVPILSRPPSERQPRQSETILNLIRKVEIICNSFDFKTPQFRGLVDHLKLEFFTEKNVVFRKGDDGDHFYIVLIGCCAVKPQAKSDQAESNSKPEIFYHPGKGFGQISLIYDVPRGATVIAYQNTTLVKIDKEYFKKCLKLQTKLVEMNTYFKQHPFLEIADDFILRIFASGSTKICFKQGEVIVKEGDQVSSLMFFIKGCVSISKRIRFRLKSGKVVQRLVEIQQLAQNGIFGEEFMISKKPCNLVVKAIDRGEYAKVQLQHSITTEDTPFARRILTHSKRSISDLEILGEYRCGLYKQVRKIQLLMGIYKKASQVNFLREKLREAKEKYKEIEQAQLVLQQQGMDIE